MTYQVVVARKANIDVVDILVWLSTDSLETADRWHAQYLGAVNSLKTFPARCSVFGRSQKRKTIRRRLFGQYAIFFSIKSTTVNVLRVRHQKREPLGEL